jgi:murein DD-endopeptidase MepM/ murein hydrolase activator NlpD
VSAPRRSGLGALRGVAGLVLAVAAVGPVADGLAEAQGEAVILSTYRSKTGVNRRPRLFRHAGVDFGGALGAPVLAAADGIVNKVIAYPPGCGTGVVIAHPAFNRYTVYCHMQRSLVRVGQSVARGETIGFIGTSGNAFGVPHVHHELCTSACSSHVDGDLRGTRDPLSIADGCFDARRIYPRDRLVLTFPVQCLWWAHEKYR